VRHELIQVSNLSAFADLRAAWTRLEAESRHHSLSVTYDYCALAAAHSLAGRAEIHIIKIYDDDGLALLWPLLVQRKGFLRMAYDLRCGSGADRGGPLMRDSASADCLRVAVSTIKQTKADLFVLDWIDDESELQKLMSGWTQPWIVRRAPQRLRAMRGSDGAQRYMIKFDGFAAWEDFMATRSRSVRYNHDRRLRQLFAEQKNVEFGWCKNADEAEHVLNWLFETKRGWAEERGIVSGTMIARDIQDFYIALARRTDLRTIPLVAVIKVDGHLIAASLNAVGPKLMECLITAHDKAFRRYSPGILLLHYRAEWAFKAGCDVDMLRTHVDHKAQWANHMPVCRRHVIFLAPNSVTGFATFAGLAIHKLGDLCAYALRSAIRRATARAGDITGRPEAPRSGV
jgi:CelD/BcsL family acetyltransferase involved in cellulose biosynthesis